LDRLAETDFVGSNISECRVFAPDLKPGWIELVELLAKSPEARIAETAENSHYYVTCTAWADANTLEVTVVGHTDEPPFHDFEHRFRYDLPTGLFTRVSDKVSPH
jgi:hypothetical protein